MWDISSSAQELTYQPHNNWAARREDSLSGTAVNQDGEICNYTDDTKRKDKTPNIVVSAPTQRIGDEEVYKLIETAFSQLTMSLLARINLLKIVPPLQHIESEIEDSRYIFDLPENWDEDGAMPIKEEVWQIAVQFLRNYAEYIWRNYNIVIEAPEINPTRGGTVDLSWTTKKNVGLLINIRIHNGEPIAFYYGELPDNIGIIKGSVSTQDVADHLAVWMKKLEAS